MGGSKKMQQVRSIANRPQGGGNKKQGLPPSTGRAGWFNNMVRTRAGGYFRDIPGPAQEVISKTVGEFNNAVRALQLDATGSYLYVGGAFTKYTSPTNVETNVNAIAKIRLSDGALVPAFVGAGEGFSGGGGDGGVIALQLSGTNLYVGGIFNNYINDNNINGNKTPLNIAKLNATTGALVPAFVGDGEGFSGGDGGVAALQLSGTDLYVGGRFNNYINDNNINGNKTPLNIAKLNATTGALVPAFVGSEEGFGGDDAPVFALQLSGTDLYVGGRFNNYINDNNINGNKTPLNIAKLNATTGALVPAFVGSEEGFGGDDAPVFALQLSGTDLYVGGRFNNYINDNNINGNKTPLNIAKLNATTGALVPAFVGSEEGFGGDDVPVYALQLSGTDLYVGGDFNSYTNVDGNKTPLNIAKLNANTGELITGFVGSGEGFSDGGGFDLNGVTVLQLSGTDLYVGGIFNSYTNVAGGGTPKYIAKLNATNGALNK